MKTEIYKSYEEFLEREDKELNGVSVGFSKNNQDYVKQNETNEGCWNCQGCYYCYDCSYCSYCYDCSR